MNVNTLPKTRKEAMAAGAAHYFTGEPCKHGHVAPRKVKGSCVECLKIEWTEGNKRRTEYFQNYNNSEAGKAAKKKYYEGNKEIVKIKAMTRPNEQRQKYRKAWKLKNPEEVKASTKHRRDKHKQATPKWLTQEQKKQIRQLYVDAMIASRVTGTPYVVDHIVPLRGDGVCGLHVPWNLQVMTRDENLRKSNKLTDA
jgi:5-methylcytosine-specific restriction endonuclease McrA